MLELECKNHTKGLPGSLTVDIQAHRVAATPELEDPVCRLCDRRVAAGGVRSGAGDRCADHVAAAADALMWSGQQGLSLGLGRGGGLWEFGGEARAGRG